MATKEPVAQRNSELDNEDLIFGGIERLVSTPMRVGVNCEASNRFNRQKELEIYMSTSSIPLRRENKKCSDPLVWWMAMEENGKFQIWAQLAKHFLAIPVMPSPLERIWSRSVGVATAIRSRLDTSVTSGIMFVKENNDILGSNINSCV